MMFPTPKIVSGVLALFTLACTSPWVAATPLAGSDDLDVFVPPILSPTSGTTWTAGQTHFVVWDTSNPPEQITNLKGSIVLKTADLESGFDQIKLADGFSILKGEQEVTLPSTLETRTDYQIVLFGDSGNASPQFTIKSSY